MLISLTQKARRPFLRHLLANQNWQASSALWTQNIRTFSLPADKLLKSDESFQSQEKFQTSKENLIQSDQADKILQQSESSQDNIDKQEQNSEQDRKYGQPVTPFYANQDEEMKEQWIEINWYLFHQGGIKEINLQEHIAYLRNPVVLYNPKIPIVLLNSLFKKMVSNEGVSNHTDIFRPHNTPKRKKIAANLARIEEVKNALAFLRKQRKYFRNNPLVGYLTFMHKCDWLTEKELMFCIDQYMYNISKMGLSAPEQDVDYDYGDDEVQNKNAGEGSQTERYLNFDSELGVMLQMMKKFHIYTFGDSRVFFRKAQEFIMFCRKYYEPLIVEGHIKLPQMIILFNNEVYFKCESLYKANCAFILANISREEGTMQKAEFLAIYETLDIFLDMVQTMHSNSQKEQKEIDQQMQMYATQNSVEMIKLANDKTKRTFLSGEVVDYEQHSNYWVLKKPALYAQFMEDIFEEINDRIIAGDEEIEDWHMALVLKTVAVKRIILDQEGPQVDYFLRYQIYFLQEQLGKRVQIEDLYLYTSLLGRYRLQVPDEMWTRINQFIVSSISKKSQNMNDKFDQRTCGKLILSLLRVKGNVDSQTIEALVEHYLDLKNPYEDQRYIQRFTRTLIKALNFRKKRFISNRLMQRLQNNK